MTTVGRYKQVKVYIREFDDVKVVLLNQETIYALPRHGAPNIIYHRFFGPLGTYPEWRKFRKAMLYNRKLSKDKIRELAIRYHIQNFGTQREPNLRYKRRAYEDLRTKTLKGGK